MFSELIRQAAVRDPGTSVIVVSGIHNGSARDAEGLLSVIRIRSDVCIISEAGGGGASVFPAGDGEEAVPDWKVLQWAFQAYKDWDQEYEGVENFFKHDFIVHWSCMGFP